ncbi:hypothetical protein [Massilia alkalitolerans]|jgi:hypothetical protein|uniref:hypothetical protein n=1 Tax=Massilia alkalitolerans TaxID=286638 RepID=UPI0012EB4330|nr:hypothetical protein [Massilia alkalitolerans]
MSPQRKLCVANVLMIVGMVPLLLGLCWIAAVIAFARQHKGQMGGSDAFLMIGVLFLAYAFALVVSGGSALWSTIVARRNAGLRARASTIIRSTTCLVLLAPLLWYAWITLRFA